MQRTIGIGEFKAKCLRLVDEVHSRRSRMVITRRGKPIAQVVPYVDAATADEGSLQGTLLFERDSLTPIDVTWEADQ